jgi:hypothetical protein
VIHFHTKNLDFSNLDHATYDRACSVYGGLKEGLPYDMPTLRGKLIGKNSFKDANIMDDVTTGKSCTGIIHLVNQTQELNAGSPSIKRPLRQQHRVWSLELLALLPNQSWTSNTLFK